MIRGRVTAGQRLEARSRAGRDAHRARAGRSHRDVQGTARAPERDVHARSPTPTRTAATPSGSGRATTSSPALASARLGTKPEHLKVGAGQEIERDFQLPRVVGRGGALRGVVRSKDTDGPPIAGAIVVAEPIGGSRPADLEDSPTTRAASNAPPIRQGHGLRPRSEGQLRRLRGARATTTTPRSRSWPGRPRRPAAGSSTRRASPAQACKFHYAMILDLDGSRALSGAGQTVETDEKGRFTAPGLIIGAEVQNVRLRPRWRQLPRSDFRGEGNPADRHRRHRTRSTGSPGKESSDALNRADSRMVFVAGALKCISRKTANIVDFLRG